MNKEELIKATILGEEHLGENLKGLCIEYIDNLQQENQKYKEVIDTIKNILNNQMNYREFVDIVNAIEDVVKEEE